MKRCREKKKLAIIEAKRKAARDRKRHSRANMGKRKLAKIRKLDRIRKAKARAKMKATDKKPLIIGGEPIKGSLIRKYSSSFRRQHKKHPHYLVPVLLHAMKQLCRDEGNREFFKKGTFDIFGRNDTGSIAKEIAKIKCLRSQKKWKEVHSAVKLIKERYTSLRAASRSSGLSWSSFQYMCSVDKKLMYNRERENYTRKLTKKLRMQISRFYRSADASISMPDRRFVGKKFLRETLPIIHQAYVAKTGHKVSFSKFAKLRPSGEVKLKKQTPHRQALCSCCENAQIQCKKLASHAVTGLHLSLSKCLQETLCRTTVKHNGLANLHRSNCIRRTCKLCGVEKYKNSVLAKNSEEVLQKSVSWHQWKNVTAHHKDKTSSKMQRVELEGTILELLNDFFHNLEDLAEHMFLARWQANDLKQTVKNLVPNEICAVLDFSLSYLAMHQSEPSGAFFEHNQITLHCAVAYYICPACENSIVTHDYVTISSDLKHDAHAVLCYEKDMIADLKDKGIAIDRVIEYTDTAVTQYRSKTSFLHLSGMGVEIIRNYFCPMHGKSVSDPLGGRTKRAVWTAVLTGEAVVTKAEDFYNYCNKKLATRTPAAGECMHYCVSYNYHPTVKRNVSKESVRVNQTRQIQQVRSTGIKGIIECRKISCSCRLCLQYGSCGCPNKEYVKDWSREPCSKSGESALKRKNPPVNTHWKSVTGHEQLTVSCNVVLHPLQQDTCNASPERKVKNSCNTWQHSKHESVNKSKEPPNESHEPTGAVFHEKAPEDLNASTPCVKSPPKGEPEKTQLPVMLPNEEAKVDWSDIYDTIAEFSDFSQLKRFAEILVLPPVHIEGDYTYWSHTDKTDKVATRYMPKLLNRQFKAGQSFGDGNCFFR